ncbi:hypothetical protein CPAR01_08419 [Colletotrichum paranaense]|uniref:proline dehydrogenase n=1 Tax=Colletotrichum paranaense TaxID=1914294 RepID=A0ABQ9SK98_9PEZI|nr:uncharacterized protein CPAR01_08419 [Colletotrichum paranaense]KAK1538306.1 hypothetical protein CPAR01_08419 [Colletotrichum paranaense]
MGTTALDSFKDITSGAAGGIAQVLIDLVKVRLQTQGGGGNALGLVRNIWTKEGPLAFYKGTLAPLLGVGACVSIQFGAFQLFRRRLEEYREIYPADAKTSSKSLSLSDFYLVGGAAGLTNSIISGPIEHVRIRLQTQPNGAARLYSGPWDCVRKITQHSGIKGLYRGQVVTLFREFHGYGIWFAAYEGFLSMAMAWEGVKDRRELASWKIAVCGGLAGEALWLGSHPLDVIKSKMQSDGFGRGQKYLTMRDAFRQTWREGRFRGLFRGLVPALLRAMPVSAGTFATAELRDIIPQRVTLAEGCTGKRLEYVALPVAQCPKSATVHMSVRRQRLAALLSRRHPAVHYANNASLTRFQSRYASTTSGNPETLPPHSKLPLKILLRSLLVATTSSHRILLGPSLAILKFLNDSHRTWVFDVQRNPLLHAILKKTMYNHFCAGENRHEVTSTIAEIKRMGFRGAILTYAREIVVDNTTEEESGRGLKEMDSASEIESDAGIDAWREGVLETADMLSEGDILALKLTGAGAAVSEALTSRKPLPAQMESALADVCSRAVERGARIFMDAEQISVQPGIDAVAIDLMRRFNTKERGAVVFNTYQAYLKSTPDTLAQHVALAHKDNFFLGIKLVRGAYISSEPRHMINDTKQATDDSYDSIARELLSQGYRDYGVPGGKSFPDIELFLATHNKDSVIKANELQQTRAKEGKALIKIQYGQLLGMADEVSFSLLQLADQGVDAKGSESDAPIEVYKCLSWGSLGDFGVHCVEERVMEEAYIFQLIIAEKTEISKSVHRTLIIVRLTRRAHRSLSPHHLNSQSHRASYKTTSSHLTQRPHLTHPPTTPLPSESRHLDGIPDNPPNMAAKGDKIEKIITRLQARIGEGQFYEAQQQTRVVAARYIKAANWPAAIDILYNVAQSLLKAEQGGSGGDLAVMLVDVFKQAELKPDAANKGKLLTLLRLFAAQEPTRKKFIGEIIAWSSKFGEYPAGDTDLHHVAGSLYAEEHDAYEAERHLVLGTKDSAEVLAKMEYVWYKEDDSHTAPLYAARAIFPYLLVGNVRAANTCYRLFASSLSDDNKGLGVQDVSSNSADLRIFPGLPLLNFLGLLLLAIQRGAPDAYKQLLAKYSSNISEVSAWSEALEIIAEMYFGISRPRQSNPLMDMMGSLFGGAGGGGAPQQRRPATRRVEAPAAEGLD